MNNVHMIGIGGIGMSALARLLLGNGVRISGCDLEINALAEELQLLGAVIYRGHSPDHIQKDTDAVIYSSAIKDDAPELAAAAANNIPVFRRARMLAMILEGKQVIAVTGTHGKTTTASIIAHIMNQAGWNVGFAVGGQMKGTGENARWGNSRYFVAETDESDGTQVYMKSHVGVITNIDNDHMDYYSDISEITGAMERFQENVSPAGFVFGCGDDIRVRRILAERKDGAFSYGRDKSNDFYAHRIKVNNMSSVFQVYYQGTEMGTICLSVPGWHNIINALAGIGVCTRLGISFASIAAALRVYPGVQRRLEVVFCNDKITVIDDYAHHPAEIKAVVAAVREKAGRSGRLWGIFQPHRFTRTRLLAEMFGGCFQGLDKLIITDIYGAGELPLPGINGRIIYSEARRGAGMDTVYIESLDDIIPYLQDHIQAGDTLLFMGAGNISRLARDVGARINDHNKMLV